MTGEERYYRSPYPTRSSRTIERFRQRLRQKTTDHINMHRRNTRHGTVMIKYDDVDACSARQMEHVECGTRRLDEARYTWRRGRGNAMNMAEGKSKTV